jgi:cystathionine beta-lyase
MYNFDQIIDRKGRHTFKWNRYQGKDILPLWVADSEFQVAKPIMNALQEEVAHGIYGYTHPEEYTPAKEAVQHWVAQQHDWNVETDWIVWTAGVVPAFNIACKAYCEPGDKVLFQEPNYPPLMAAPGINKLEAVPVQSIDQGDRWTLDFEQLEREAADPKAKLFILCNPMNPVGSVLTQDELQQITTICEKHDVRLCSDEIHCDLILTEGKTHLPAGKFDPTAITLMAASKTFNVAGLGTSFAIIPDKTIRQQFQRAMQGNQPWVTKFGLLATEKAFTECDDWYHALVSYLRSNRDFLNTELNKVNGLSYRPADATFLAWVDCSGLALKDRQSWFEQRGVGPSPGRDFRWPHYARLNFACPKTYLTEAVNRLTQV